MKASLTAGCWAGLGFLFVLSFGFFFFSFVFYVVVVVVTAAATSGRRNRKNGIAFIRVTSGLPDRTGLRLRSSLARQPTGQPARLLDPVPFCLVEMGILVKDLLARRDAKVLSSGWRRDNAQQRSPPELDRRLVVGWDSGATSSLTKTG